MFIPNNLLAKLELPVIIETIKQNTLLETSALYFDTCMMNDVYEYREQAETVNTILRSGISISLRQYNLSNADNILEYLTQENSVIKEDHLSVLGSVIKYLAYIKINTNEFIDNIFTANIDSRELVNIQEMYIKIANSDGNIRDNASKELNLIRLRISSLEKKHDSLIHSVLKKYESILMSDRITLSESRIVLQIQANHKRNIKGILHDYSDSEKTVFVEPDEFIQYNNELKDLRLDEHNEVMRLLKDFTDSFKSLLSVQALKRILVKADTINAIINYIKNNNASYLAPKETIRLKNARNPVLVLTIGKQTVPFDLNMDKISFLITGPNMGGKTVIIKSLGIFAMMMKKGLPSTCAEGSSMPFFDNVFADIGDDQSIEKGVSTFASHLQNYKAFTEAPSDNTLILLDEVGTGTSANEGAAFAVSLLDYLIERKAVVIFTSHLDALKEYAERRECIEYASMMYDTVNNQAMYKLDIGTMGTSGVINLIKRYEFPDKIISDSESILGKDYLDYSKLSMMYRKKIEEAESLQDQLKMQKKAIDKLKLISKSKEELLDDKLKHLGKSFKSKKDEELKKMRSELEQFVKEIRESNASKETIIKARDFISSQIQESENEYKQVKSKCFDDIEINDHIVLEGNIEGIVEKIENERIVVNVNGLRINTFVSKIISVLKSDTEQQISIIDSTDKDITKVDLRGLYSDEAETELCAIIDRGKALDVQSIEIIHGHGTGVLKAVVRDYLKKRKDIKGFKTGLDLGLNDGITVVYIKG